MKKTLILIIMSCSLIINLIQAQDLLTYKTSETAAVSEITSETVSVFRFKAYSIDYELENVSIALAGNHQFGDVIAKKLYLFDRKYTTQVALAPGNPALKTVIKKPVIYESIKRIEKDLKRSVRKGLIPLNTAISEFNVVLDIALNILTTDTKEFEKALESAATTDLKVDLFTRRVILNY
ncbi:MAG: hypothetical protein IPN67_09070 [Bacteroidales bacterium]|nr:hypothetical protein [Bacteroidales bacterium]